LGQAAAYLQLAAWEQGVGSCLTAMWEGDKAKEILGVPPEMYFRYVISFGYPSVTTLTAPKPDGRKSFEEVVRWEKW
jgi:nitroreductase